MKGKESASPGPTSGDDRWGTDAFLSRLEAILKDAKMPNGTSAAAAVHTAVIAELVVTGRPVTDLESLSDAQLKRTCRNLAEALESGGGMSICLPFGTMVVSPVPGTLAISEQEFVLDAGRAGLHPLAAVRGDAHGPNLERLRVLITDKTRALACHRLGVPTPKHMVDSDSRQGVQFAPLAEAGGVVLQRPTEDAGADRFCAALPWQIEELADSMVAEMKIVWRRRVRIATRVKEVRFAAEAGTLAEADTQTSVELISIQDPGADGEGVSLYVEYRAIDDALRPGTVLAYVPAYMKLDEILPPCLVLARVGMRERLAQVGATGWIDGLAEALARAAPRGCSAVLASLADQYETTVSFPSRNGVLRARLYWLDGRITASMSLPGTLRWSKDELELIGTTLPETVVQNLPGQCLSQVVELPFYTDLKILDAKVVVGSTVLTFEPTEKLVNCEQRVILDTPALDRRQLFQGI